jgi:hypothetical protein
MALLTKAEHVKRQNQKRERTKGKASPRTHTRSGPTGSLDATRVRNTAATAGAARTPLAGGAPILAFWSPIAVLLRQQTLFASMVQNVVQAQRLWTALAFNRSA